MNLTTSLARIPLIFYLKSRCLICVFVILSRVIGPFTKKKVAPSEKVTPSEEVEKGNIFLDNIEEQVFTIHGNYLDHFQWHSTS